MQQHPRNKRTSYEHARLLIDSYKKWTGRTLLASSEALVEKLFHAPFVVLSHGTEADPILNYGNKAALTLWEMDWDQFTRTPSRETAEPVEQSAREEFLRKVSQFGYVDDYTGIRISRTGKRFFIMNATVWNLVDDTGKYYGQAATFREYRYIE